MPYESIRFDNIYIGKQVEKELKCTSAWYTSRWGNKNHNENTRL